MASLVKDLIESGVHFGHRSTNWNPKMAPYIFGKRNKIHIIDVKATIKGLLLARKFLTRVVADGKDVLFVGTKRQARGCIARLATESGMHYVTERWLGGTLTNFRTIRERLKRLEELERLEQSGEIDNYSKKMESQLRREKAKILRNLEGIRRMTTLPGAMVVIDVKREINAVKEARKLGIPTVGLVDTDSDPDFADIAIPGNDDAMRAIEVVVDSLCKAVMEGKSARAIAAEGADSASAHGSGGSGVPQRRSERAQYSASAAASTPGGQDAGQAVGPEGSQDAAPAGDEPAAPAPQEPAVSSTRQDA
jgi:small subunit ribosomal protein S2